MNIRINFSSPETPRIVLPNAENRTIVSSFVWTQYRNVKDRQTDRQTDRRTESREQCGRAVKMRFGRELFFGVFRAQGTCLVAANVVLFLLALTALPESFSWIWGATLWREKRVEREEMAGKWNTWKIRKRWEKNSPRKLISSYGHDWTYAESLRSGEAARRWRHTAVRWLAGSLQPWSWPATSSIKSFHRGSRTATSMNISDGKLVTCSRVPDLLSDTRISECYHPAFLYY